MPSTEAATGTRLFEKFLLKRSYFLSIQTHLLRFATANEAGGGIGFAEAR